VAGDPKRAGAKAGPLRGPLHRGAGARHPSCAHGAGRGRAALRGGRRRRHGDRDPQWPDRTVGLPQRARCRALPGPGRHGQRALSRAWPSNTSGTGLRRGGGPTQSSHRPSARALHGARRPTGRALRLPHRFGGRGRHHQPSHLAVALAEEAGRGCLSPDDAARHPRPIAIATSRSRSTARRPARAGCSRPWSPIPRTVAAA
jgi:hypothetical protein